MNQGRKSKSANPTYRVVDARKSVTVADGVAHSIYREAQLALRAVVATRELDAFLADKDAVTEEFAETMRRRAVDLGLEAVSVTARGGLSAGPVQAFASAPATGSRSGPESR
ncbi:SPFH domain-containing protein [Pirellulimonas nuda]|nr:SPFH domain-containing protein [Pirellulimonas nuda]